MRIHCCLVMIDEASMVDILLMNNLLKAVPPEATLLLIGDVDQLPSVGPGDVLRDIIASERVETVRLMESFRQAEESLIVVNAHRVDRSEFPQIRTPKGGMADFYFIQRDEPEKALELVKELCAKRLPRDFHFNPLDDIQVMTPMHKGVIGVANLNAELQSLFNPKGGEIPR